MSKICCVCNREVLTKEAIPVETEGQLGVRFAEWAHPDCYESGGLKKRRSYGKELQSLVLHSLNSVGAWYHNYDDIGRQSYKKNRVWTRRPADIQACVNSTSAMIECKEVRKHYFSFSRLKEHQEVSLFSHYKNGGVSIVLIAHINGRFKVYYAISIQSYLNLKQTIGRKSIPLTGSVDKSLVRLKLVENPRGYGDKILDLRSFIRRQKKNG